MINALLSATIIILSIIVSIRVFGLVFIKCDIYEQSDLWLYQLYQTCRFQMSDSLFFKLWLIFFCNATILLVESELFLIPSFAYKQFTIYEFSFHHIKSSFDVFTLHAWENLNRWFKENHNRNCLITIVIKLLKYSCFFIWNSDLS